MYNEIEDFLEKSTLYISKKEAILIRQEEIDISKYQTFEIYYMVNECIDVIISYMKNGKTNLIVEEKLLFFFNFFKKCSDDIKTVTINLLYEKYNITDESFHLQEWKDIYNQYRS